MDVFESLLFFFRAFCFYLLCNLTWQILGLIWDAIRGVQS